MRGEGERESPVTDAAAAAIVAAEQRAHTDFAQQQLLLPLLI